MPTNTIFKFVNIRPVTVQPAIAIRLSHTPAIAPLLTEVQTANPKQIRQQALAAYPDFIKPSY